MTNPLSGCFAGKSLQLEVKAGPRVKKTVDVLKCGEAGLANGVETFCLASLETEFLGGQTASDFLIAYHFSPTTAANGTAPIANPEGYQNTTSPFFQTIYIRVKNINSVTSCIAVTSVDLIVEPLINPQIIERIQGAFCFIEVMLKA